MIRVFLHLKQNKDRMVIMKKRITLITAALLLFSVQNVFAAKIMNNNVTVRTMPGAFYPVVTILSKGAEVELLHEQNQWKKVKTTEQKIGWISANAFNPVKQSIDYGAMSNDNSKKNITKLMVTAAVKGFFENNAPSPQINKEVFLSPFRRYIIPSRMNQFREATYKGRWSQKKFQRKNKIRQEGPFVIDENMVALSAYIAARFASPGLSSDLIRTVYVNQVAQLIIEGTEFYDLPISVLVVESNEIFANATPIGVIVLSTGMLNTIQTESELACLLAHEIAHVTLGHGSTEFNIRKPKFAAEDAFAELGDELGVDETEAELDQLCNEMYERAFRGRKAEYEMAADKRGMIYARRAGYNADGMVSLLKRLKTKVHSSRNPEDMSHWFPRAMQKRIDIIEKYAKKELKKNKRYATFADRYQKNNR